jgi:hypothetical protein
LPLASAENQQVNRAEFEAQLSLILTILRATSAISGVTDPDGQL